ncbi:MAG: transcriptional regulator, GntR family, partial [Planctomycetota bacterium]
CHSSPSTCPCTMPTMPIRSGPVSLETSRDFGGVASAGGSGAFPHAQVAAANAIAAPSTSRIIPKHTRGLCRTNPIRPSGLSGRERPIPASGGLDKVSEYETIGAMLTVSLASPVPLHDQIVGGLRNLIAAGALVAGDELPPVRQLAADLGINLNTVARAYRELTDAGLLASVRGRGTVVIATVERPSGPKVEERKRIEAGIASAMGDAKIAGFSREAIESIVQRQFDRLWKQA